MKQKKVLFLFLALLFPICIFLFLKIFGKNEFAVAPLYKDVHPETLEGCERNVALPYVIPDSVRSRFPVHQDSLGLIYFGSLRESAAVQMKRVRKDFGTNVRLFVLSPAGNSALLRSCVFFLKDPYDLVLIDPSGTIRGQYIAADREEIDRLLAELTILFKQY